MRPRLGGLDAAIGTHGAVGVARNARVPESGAPLERNESGGGPAASRRWRSAGWSRQRDKSPPRASEQTVGIFRRAPRLRRVADGGGDPCARPHIHPTAASPPAYTPPAMWSFAATTSAPTRAPGAYGDTAARVAPIRASRAPAPPLAARVGARVGVPRSHSPRERRLVTVPPPMRLHPLESSRAPGAPPAVNPRTCPSARPASPASSAPPPPPARSPSTPTPRPNPVLRPTHRAVRINAEWDAIHAKIAGDDVAYRDCRVACIVAALELPPDGTLPPGFDVESLDGACVVPAGADGSPLVVLGTLDVNQGTKLPAEELTGVYPTLADPVPPGTRLDEDGKGTNAEGTARMKTAPGTRPARYRRAYLSNVCVLPPARRTGVGRRLMEEALEVARGWGWRGCTCTWWRITSGRSRFTKISVSSRRRRSRRNSPRALQAAETAPHHARGMRGERNAHFLVL